MRSLLVCIMLVIVVIMLYESTIGGDDGSLQVVKRRGNQVNEEIEGIDP